MARLFFGIYADRLYIGISPPSLDAAYRRRVCSLHLTRAPPITFVDLLAFRAAEVTAVIRIAMPVQQPRAGNPLYRFLPLMRIIEDFIATVQPLFFLGFCKTELLPALAMTGLDVRTTIRAELQAIGRQRHARTHY